MTNIIKDKPRLGREGPSGPHDGYYTRLCVQLLDFYQSIQSETGQCVPPRAAFEMARVQGLSPQLALTEIEDAGIVRIRRVGSGIAANVGFNITGRNYLDFVAPDRRGQAFDRVQRACGHPCGTHSALRIRSRNAFRISEGLMLPLADREGAVTYQLALFAPVIEDCNDAQEDPLRLTVETSDEFRWVDIGAGTPA